MLTETRVSNVQAELQLVFRQHGLVLDCCEITKCELSWLTTVYMYFNVNNIRHGLSYAITYADMTDRTYTYLVCQLIDYVHKQLAEIDKQKLGN